MTIKEFIQAAIEGGWKFNEVVDKSTTFLYSEDLGPTQKGLLVQDRDIFLDPRAWEAVVTQEFLNDDMWDSSDKQQQDIKDIAQTRMHGMITALCTGKTVEGYITTL